MGTRSMKKKHLLFRCHGATAEADAQAAAEFVRGYFDLWRARAKMSVEPMKDRILMDDDAPLPFDVFIETADLQKVSIAHAAGWSYLVGKEVRSKQLEKAERDALPPIRSDE